MPRPPAKENKTLTWPDWPLKLRTSSSHEEGCERDWAVVTKRAIGSNGKIEALECVRIEWVKSDDGRRSEEHTSELQSLMRISYAVFCLKTKQANEQKISELQSNN